MMAIGCGLLVLIVSAMGQYDEYEIAPTVHVSLPFAFLFFFHF